MFKGISQPHQKGVYFHPREYSYGLQHSVKQKRAMRNQHKDLILSYGDRKTFQEADPSLIYVGNEKKGEVGRQNKELVFSNANQKTDYLTAAGEGKYGCAMPYFTARKVFLHIKLDVFLFLSQDGGVCAQKEAVIAHLEVG